MSYQRIAMTKLGPPIVLKAMQEPSLPVPIDNDVRINIIVLGASSTDTMIRKGQYPHVTRLPIFSPGYNVVSIVDAVGTRVGTFKQGNYVAALILTGSYEEYLCRSASALIPVPNGVDPGQDAPLS